MQTIETEVRFIELNVPALIRRAVLLGAKDLGEDLLAETIFYDKEHTWTTGENQKFVRVRKDRNGVLVSFKQALSLSASGTKEIEFRTDDAEKVKNLLEAVNLEMARTQEKKRHTLVLDNVTIDIDTWPNIPSIVELEGPSEQALKDAAAKLEIDWSKANFHNQRSILETTYNIPMLTLKYFTFDRVE